MQFLDDGQVRLLLDKQAVMRAVADAMTGLSADRGASPHRVTAEALAGSLRTTSLRVDDMDRACRPLPAFAAGAVTHRTRVDQDRIM